MIKKSVLRFISIVIHVIPVLGATFQPNTRNFKIPSPLEVQIDKVFKNGPYFQILHPKTILGAKVQSRVKNGLYCSYLLE